MDETLNHNGPPLLHLPSKPSSTAAPWRLVSARAPSLCVDSDQPLGSSMLGRRSSSTALGSLAVGGNRYQPARQGGGTHESESAYRRPASAGVLRTKKVGGSVIASSGLNGTSWGKPSKAVAARPKAAPQGVPRDQGDLPPVSPASRQAFTSPGRGREGEQKSAAHPRARPPPPGPPSLRHRRRSRRRSRHSPHCCFCRRSP